MTKKNALRERKFINDLVSRVSKLAKTSGLRLRETEIRNFKKFVYNNEALLVSNPYVRMKPADPGYSYSTEKYRKRHIRENYYSLDISYSLMDKDELLFFVVKSDDFDEDTCRHFQFSLNTKRKNS